MCICSTYILVPFFSDKCIQQRQYRCSCLAVIYPAPKGQMEGFHFEALDQCRRCCNPTQIHISVIMGCHDRVTRILENGVGTTKGDR